MTTQNIPSTEDIRESYAMTGDGLDFKQAAQRRREEFDAWLAEQKAEALREVAADWDAEYERLTVVHGGYGQMKVRAAYRLGSQLLSLRAGNVE